MKDEFEKAYHNFLRKLGWTQYEIDREQEEDNLFLRGQLSYSELEEVFLAGWEAHEQP